MGMTNTRRRRSWQHRPPLTQIHRQVEKTLLKVSVALPTRPRLVPRMGQFRVPDSLRDTRENRLRIVANQANSITIGTRRRGACPYPLKGRNCPMSITGPFPVAVCRKGPLMRRSSSPVLFTGILLCPALILAAPFFGHSPNGSSASAAPIFGNVFDEFTLGRHRSRHGCWQRSGPKLLPHLFRDRGQGSGRELGGDDFQPSWHKRLWSRS